MSETSFVQVASELDEAGLEWQPEIGDEVVDKGEPRRISILVDPNGMTPVELRHTYLWLPTVEQMVLQIEVRQAILFHAGLELAADRMRYKSVIQSQFGAIEAVAASLRTAVGITLRDLLLTYSPIH